MARRTKKTMPRKFWEWFDQKRREKDLNDTGVANSAGIAQSVISKARNEERPIGIDSLTRIAHAFNTPVVSVLQVAGIIPPQEALSPEKAEFLQLFDAMTDEDREEMSAMMKVKARRKSREKEKAE